MDALGLNLESLDMYKPSGYIKPLVSINIKPMATSPITPPKSRTASLSQDGNKIVSKNRDNQSINNNPTLNSAEKGGAREELNQPSRNKKSTKGSIQQRQIAIARWDTKTEKIYNTPPSSPVGAGAVNEENVGNPDSPSSPIRSQKKRKLDDATYSTPDRSTPHSTPFGTPQTPKDNKLPAQASSVLKEIGIPEKAINKLEIIISKTYGNYALCGSAALAIHMKSAGLKNEFEVGDLDIVYTGSNNTDSVARDLQPALNSPKSKANTTQGQILLAVLRTEEKGEFKIDLVPQKPEFATEYVTINDLHVASLGSLGVAYSLTEKGQYGEKSKSARRKLDIISELEELARASNNGAS